MPHRSLLECCLSGAPSFCCPDFHMKGVPGPGSILERSGAEAFLPAMRQRMNAGSPSPQAESGATMGHMGSPSSNTQLLSTVCSKVSTSPTSLSLGPGLQTSEAPNSALNTR